MPIQDLRNTVTSVEHAFSALEAIDADHERRITRFQVGAWLALVAGLAIPGPIGSTALCLGALAAMYWLRLVVVAAGRYWFMHQLALCDLTAPPNLVDWNFLRALLERLPKHPAAAAAESSEEERVH